LSHNPRFNLVTDKWFPITNQKKLRELVSLEELFESGKYGTYLNIDYLQMSDKVALLKFLITLAMAAGVLPEDNAELREIISSPDIVAKKVSEYLQKNKELFYLYGERPFLQSNLQIPSFGNLDLNDLVRDGKDRHAQSDRDRPLSPSDAEISLLVLRQQAYSLNKKYGRTNVQTHYAVLHPGLTNKPLLSIFMESESFQDLIPLNIMTINDIESLGLELGRPLWEFNLNTEEGFKEAEESCRKSFLGYMLPFNKFLKINTREGKAIYATGFKDFWWENDNSYQPLLKITTTKTVGEQKQKIEVLSHYPAVPGKKLWQEFSSLLATTPLLQQPPKILNYHRYKDYTKDLIISSYGLETKWNSGLYYADSSLESFLKLSPLEAKDLFDPETPQAQEYKVGVVLAEEGLKRLSSACNSYDNHLKRRPWSSKEKVENFYWDCLHRSTSILIKSSYDSNGLSSWRATIAEAQEIAFDYLEKSDKKSLRAHIISRKFLKEYPKQN